MNQSELLEKLKDYLESARIDAFLTNVKGVDVLKATLTGLGEKEDGSAITEINFMNFDEMGVPVFQIFTTVALNIDEENIEPCITELSKYNLEYVLLGYFQVYEPYRQIYHRYTQVLIGSDEEQEEQAKAALDLVTTQISAAYDDIIKYAEDAS